MQRKVEIGMLRHFIEVQKNEVGTDDYGFQTAKWTTVYKTRAMMEFDKSYKLNKEIYNNEGIDTASTRIFVFRKHPRLEIGVKDRIKYKDKFYQIYIVNDIDEEGRFIRTWASTINQE